MALDAQAFYHHEPIDQLRVGHRTQGLRFLVPTPNNIAGFVPRLHIDLRYAADPSKIHLPLVPV